MTDILTSKISLKDQNAYLTQYLLDEYGIGVSPQLSAIGIAVGLLAEQKTILDGVRELIAPKETLVEVEDKDANAILLANINRDIMYAAKASHNYSGTFPNTNNTARLLTGFIEKFGQDLWPDSQYHMTSPVGMFDGYVVEAKTRKLATRFKLHIDSDPADIDKLYEDLFAEFRYEIGTLDEGDVFCPYVPLITTGAMIDPETFEPVVGFMTRYGILSR